MRPSRHKLRAAPALPGGAVRTRRGGAHGGRYRVGRARGRRPGGPAAGRGPPIVREAAPPRRSCARFSSCFLWVSAQRRLHSMSSLLGEKSFLIVLIHQSARSESNSRFLRAINTRSTPPGGKCPRLRFATKWLESGGFLWGPG